MNTKQVARKYLNIILVLTIVLIGLSLYKSDVTSKLARSTNIEIKGVVEKKKLKDKQKQQDKKNQLQIYINYLTSSTTDLQAVESSASLKIDRLHLGKTYLAD